MKADGMFIAVVGPSGAGKDSLIAYVREELRGNESFVFPMRMITRPPDATEISASATPEMFRTAQNLGAFSLHWDAHGIQYGLPASIKMQLAEGKHVIANISRGAVAEARRRFSRSSVVLVTANPKVLRERLRARGRETEAEQESRLQRNATGIPPFCPDLVIANDGRLEEAGDNLVRWIRHMAGPCLFALGR